MSRLILLNKPYDVLCQFSDGEGRPTLADHLPVKAVYPAGRLDRDSEGLVVLTDDGRLQAQIADPRHKMEKTYLAQVEGLPEVAQLAALSSGVTLKDGPTLPAKVRAISPPDWLWPREPPIRVRQTAPDARLRLIRWRVGEWTLEGLTPGAWRDVLLPQPDENPHAPRIRRPLASARPGSARRPRNHR